MAKRPTATPSTEARADYARRLVPRAYDASMIGGDSALPIPPGAAALEALLGESAAVMVGYEVLAEMGGMLPQEMWTGMLCARLAISERAAALAMGRLKTIGVAIPVIAGDEAIPYVLLPRQNAWYVAPAIVGASLPAPPPNDVRAIPGRIVSHALRDSIALVGALAHRQVRFTLELAPHRGSLKRLATALSVDVEFYESTLLRARDLGMLGAAGDAFAPIVSRLRERASGLVGGRVVDALIDRLPEGTWVPRAKLERSLLRTFVDAQLFDLPGALTLEQAIAGARLADIDASTALEHVEWQGHRFVRRVSAASENRDSTGDGHVTPNFDVMLGPGATSDVTLVIALCAEPVRVDRMLTYRLTPASVTAGVCCRLEPDEILRALDHVGRGPCPDGVRQLVGEWCARARPARVRRVWSVEVPREAHAVVAAALGDALVGSPAPGVLHVGDEVRIETIDEALRTAKIPRLSIEPLRATGMASKEDSRVAMRATRSNQRAVSEAPRPDDAFDLHAHAADARAVRAIQAFGDEARAAFEAAASESATMAALPLCFAEAIDEVGDQVRRDIDRYSASLPPNARGEFDRMRDDTLAWFPWNVFDRSVRRRLLEGVATRRDLVMRACDEATSAEVSEVGWKLIEEMRNHPPFLPALMAPFPIEVDLAREILFDRYEELRDSAAMAASVVAAATPKAAKSASIEGEVFTTPAGFAEAFERAAASKRRVAVFTHSAPTRPYVLVPDRVDRAGGDIRLLGLDVTDDKGRSFPVGRVARIVLMKSD